MKKSHRQRTSPAGQRGFTLVEMMVALVVGLIVSGAAAAFVVSIAKANSQDLQVTRLTQELRAVSEVVNREIRRARYVADPLANIAQGGPTAPNDAITIVDSAGGAGSTDCITLRYDRDPTDPLAGTTVIRTVYLDSGRVYVTDLGTCSGGQAISSPEVTITEFSFDNDTDGTNAVAAVEAFVRSRVGGHLNQVVGEMASLNRTFQQDTHIRSGKVN